MNDRVGVQRCHSCQQQQQQQAWESNAKLSTADPGSRLQKLNIYIYIQREHFLLLKLLRVFFFFFTTTLLQQAAVELINKLLVGGLRAATGGNQQCLVSLPSYQT